MLRPTSLECTLLDQVIADSFLINIVSISTACLVLLCKQHVRLHTESVIEDSWMVVWRVIKHLFLCSKTLAEISNLIGWNSIIHNHREENDPY